VIYVDTSVLLAHLFVEAPRPPDSLWSEVLVASRLVEYETWVRVHALGRAATHGEGARALLGRLGFVEMTPTVLARATEPFPSPVRTLDALHLASIEFLRAHRQDVRLATYDKRLAGAARRLGIPAYPLGR
jgi:predicted nucleic acid-binding protein